jgi:hypothetical protein
MVPKGSDNAQMIPLLEKFVNEQNKDGSDSDEIGDFEREANQHRQEADPDRQDYPES